MELSLLALPNLIRLLRMAQADHRRDSCRGLLLALSRVEPRPPAMKAHASGSVRFFWTELMSKDYGLMFVCRTQCECRQATADDSRPSAQHYAASHASTRCCLPSQTYLHLQQDLIVMFYLLPHCLWTFVLFYRPVTAYHASNPPECQIQLVGSVAKCNFSTLTQAYSRYIETRSTVYFARSPAMSPLA